MLYSQYESTVIYVWLEDIHVHVNKYDMAFIYSYSDSPQSTMYYNTKQTTVFLQTTCEIQALSMQVVYNFKIMIIIKNNKKPVLRILHYIFKELNKMNIMILQGV